MKSIADFLLFLFQDKKLQPSTIDSHRSAIADKLGNSPINVNKHKNLTHLLDSSTDTALRVGGSVPCLEPIPGASPADRGAF